MRPKDSGCQIVLRFFIDSILDVSYFPTDNVVIQLTLSIAASGVPPLLTA
jgi:hypothetical protein